MSTTVKKEQIRDGAIDNAKVEAAAGIEYSKLNLTGAIQDSDLSAGELHLAANTDVLVNKKLAAFVELLGFTASGGSTVITTEVEGAASVDTPQTSPTAEGILVSTGNYKVPLRLNSNGDPIPDDPTNDPVGEVYAELTESGGVWTLTYYKQDGSPFTFAAPTDVDLAFMEVFNLLTLPAKTLASSVSWVDDAGITGYHSHVLTDVTDVDASAAELNILDGALLSTAELNVLAGMTATTAELNILDGATLDVDELNILDGVTVTTADINDLVTATLLASTGAGEGAALVGIQDPDDLYSATDVEGALKEASYREATEEFDASGASQTFTLATAWANNLNTNLRVYLNGLRIKSADYTYTAATKVLDFANPGTYTIEANDDVVVDVSLRGA